MSTTYFALASSDLTQDWSDTALITGTDDWTGVPSIVGFYLSSLSGVAGSGATNPQTVLTDTGFTADVIAQSSAANGTGGVHEVVVAANPVVGFQGSGTARAPGLLFHLDATGVENVTFSALLRKLDGDTATQPVAFQYRIGESGDFTNIPGAYVANANAASDTPVSFVLPADANDQSQVQIRVLTTDAAGTDAMIGVDDIVISSDPIVVAPLFTADFNDFTGAGFAPEPAAGQLDSDVYALEGMSDGNVLFGETRTTGDFARGATSGGVTTGGVYALNRGGGNAAFWVQPGGDDLTPGEFTIRITNTGAAGNEFSLAYDLLVLNDQARANTFNVSVSTDNVTFTDLSTLDYTSPAAADALGVQTLARSGSFSFASAVDTGGAFFVRFTSNDAGGSGSRDEFGLDNIVVTAGAEPTPGVLSIADAVVAEADSGTTVMSFTVTRSGGSDGAITVDYAVVFDGTASAADLSGATAGQIAFADGETSRTIEIAVQGDTEIELNETFSVQLSNPTGGAVLGDPQATGTIGDNDTPVTAIYAIQGAAHLSTYDGQSIVTTGIVTAVAGNGFYLQDPTGDGDVATSDAIFVFTSSAPAVLAGDAVRVAGTIDEFTPGGVGTNNLSSTQVVAPTVTVLSSGNALPTAVVLGVDRLPPTETIEDDNFASFDPATDGIDFYESLEGMLVTVKDPVAVAATNSFGEIFTVANDGAGATNYSERGVVTIDGSGGDLSRTDEGPGSDFNPERIQIDGASFTPGGAVTGIPDVVVGAKLNDVTGVIAYNFGNYEVLATSAVTVEAPSTLEKEVSAITGSEDRMTVASYNVHNLDLNDADGDTDVANGQFTLIAQDIVNHLNAPDIIALQEVQDNSGSANDGTISASATLQKLVDEIAAAGGPQYQWIDNTFIGDDSNGGEPGGNIRTAYLYNPERVELVAGSVRTIEQDGQQTDTGNPFYASRLPLIATFEFNGAQTTLVNNHFTSKGGSSPLYGTIQSSLNGSADQRLAQAEAVAQFVTGEQANVDGVVVLGDLNEFQFEDSLDPLYAAGLANLMNTLPETERYSYVFEGNAQSLDQMFVTAGLAGTVQFDAVHVNSEFGLAGASDHDPLLASFLFEANAVPEAGDDAVSTKKNNAVRIDVLANDSDADGQEVSVLSFTDPARGSVSVNSDGSLTYTPDRNFTGTDTFEYQISDGAGGVDTATVTVKVANALLPIKDTFIGTEGRDTLVAVLGGNFLDGRGGNDTLIGGLGDDVLLGGTGDDRLIGSLGDDLLRGGAGRDELNGGLGDNRFVFDDGDTGATVATADRIIGFDGPLAGDVIDLSLVDAVMGGNDDAFQFIGTGAFTGAAGELRYQFQGGSTEITGDLDGDGSADLMIVLSNQVQLSANNFVF